MQDRCKSTWKNRCMVRVFNYAAHKVENFWTVGSYREGVSGQYGVYKCMADIVEGISLENQVHRRSIVPPQYPISCRITPIKGT